MTSTLPTELAPQPFLHDAFLGWSPQDQLREARYLLSQNFLLSNHSSSQTLFLLHFLKLCFVWLFGVFLACLFILIFWVSVSIMEPGLSWNSLYKLGWLWTHRDIPASVSRLKMCATTTWLQVERFYLLYLPPCISSPNPLCIFVSFVKGPVDIKKQLHFYTTSHACFV